MTEGGKLFLVFGGSTVVVAAGWWLFQRVFGTPRPDPTGSPPLEHDPTWLQKYGGRDHSHDDPGTGGPVS